MLDAGFKASALASRLGVVHSAQRMVDHQLMVQALEATWSLTLVGVAHILLAGTLFLASCWHWQYWALDVFLFENTLSLDLPVLLGQHLVLASLACSLFGGLHLTGQYGPGMWTTDPAGLLGGTRDLQPVYSVGALSPASYGALASHHITAGSVGTLVGLWHCQARPQPTLITTLQSTSLESILGSNLPSIFLAAILSFTSVWDGALSCPGELCGPTRYHWDMNTFANIILGRVSTSARASSICRSRS